MGEDTITIRVIYGFYTLIALGAIILQIRLFGKEGLFSPLTWVLLGFVYFFFLNPIINAEYFILYSKASLYLPLVLTVFAGMASLIAGFFLASPIKWSWLGRWIAKPISSGRLATRLIFFWGIYIFLIYYISRSIGYSFYEFISQNFYLFGRKELLMEQFAGLSYYFFYILRQLPVALAVPSIYCITTKNTPKWKSLLILAGLSLSVLSSINAGGRMILCYILGGPCVYFFIRSITSMQNRRLNVMLITVLGGSLFGLFLLTSLQIHFRSDNANIRISSVRMSDLFQGIERNILDETTDQNFTLYQVVDAERSGKLKYLWGESYALAFVAMVPRSIWANKPGGADMYYKLEVIDPWGANVNISHSFMGELIYNFGGWAVIPGSLFFGLWAGVWWKVFRRYRAYTRMHILYAMSVVPLSFMVRGTFAAMFGGLLYPMLLTILILAFTKPTHRP